MIHEMKLREVYFNKIKSGEKIYEIRLNDEKRQLIDVADILIFKKQPDLQEELKTEVKDLIYFKSFKEMIDTLPLVKVGFEKESKQQVLDIYRQFYSVEDEQKYGVLAIKVNVLKS